MRFNSFAAHYAGKTFKDLEVDHVCSRSHRQLKIADTELNVVAETLNDLHPAEASTAHHFEIAEDTPIYY